jgi:hypothetical protein
LQADASFVDHLHAMKRNDNCNDDGDGPFDFRSILRKSEFAPTESLRRRRGNNGAQPNIPRIVKSPVHEVIEYTPSVVYDEDTVIDL